MAPRMYCAMDAGFTSSAAVERLGEAYGPAGPMVLVSLLGMAKQQGDRGAAKTTCRKLSEDSFAGDRKQVEAIVRDAIEFGVLEGIELDERVIYIRFVRWESWQKRLSDSERQALKRARDNGAVK